MKQKKVLFINCGWEQFPTIELLYKKNYELYGICFNKNIYHKKFFKKIFYCKFEDINKIYNFVKKIKPTGIISDQCDFSYLIHSKISNKFKLIGPNINKALIFTNKLLQRKKLSESRLKFPKFFSAKKFDELKKNINTLKTKIVVIKPIDNRGGFGVVIKRKKEINNSDFLKSLKHSKCKTVIVEEFIDGVHYNLDGLVFKKKSILIGVSKNRKMKNKIVNESLSYEERFLNNIKFKNYFKNLCNLLKPTYGLLHAEIIISKNNIYLTEIANRGGGIRISNTVLNYTSGYDINEYLIDSSLFKKFNLKKFNNNQNKNVLIKFFNSHYKKIKINYDKNKNILFCKKLSKARNIVNSSKRNFLIMASGSTINNAKKSIKGFLKK